MQVNLSLENEGTRTFDFFLFRRLLWQRVEGDTAGEASVVQHRVDRAREAAKHQLARQLKGW